MDKEFKVGDIVVIIDDYDRADCINEYRERKDLKNQIGKIVKIYPTFYSIKIISCPYKKECRHFKDYCYNWYDTEIKSVNSLKLKKFVEHGV